MPDGKFLIRPFLASIAILPLFWHNTRNSFTIPFFNPRLANQEVKSCTERELAHK